MKLQNRFARVTKICCCDSYSKKMKSSFHDSMQWLRVLNGIPIDDWLPLPFLSTDQPSASLRYAILWSRLFSFIKHSLYSSCWESNMKPLKNIFIILSLFDTSFDHRKRSNNYSLRYIFGFFRSPCEVGGKFWNLWTSQIVFSVIFCRHNFFRCFAHQLNVSSREFFVSFAMILLLFSNLQMMRTERAKLKKASVKNGSTHHPSDNNRKNSSIALES